MARKVTPAEEVRLSCPSFLPKFSDCRNTRESGLAMPEVLPLSPSYLSMQTRLNILGTHSGHCWDWGMLVPYSPGLTQHGMEYRTTANHSKNTDFRVPQMEQIGIISDSLDFNTQTIPSLGNVAVREYLAVAAVQCTVINGQLHCCAGCYHHAAVTAWSGSELSIPSSTCGIDTRPGCHASSDMEKTPAPNLACLKLAGGFVSKIKMSKRSHGSCLTSPISQGILGFNKLGTEVPRPSLQPLGSLTSLRTLFLEANKIGAAGALARSRTYPKLHWRRCVWAQCDWT
jgi:hypothetical protein